MDYSSLVLMEKDKDSNILAKEIGSYKVDESSKYITKLFYDGEYVNLYFDTNRDLEDWEFSGIFDVFDEEYFTQNGCKIESIDSEYNPTWLLKFSYIEDHEEMQKKLMEICKMIDFKMNEAFEAIKGKEEEYK